MFARIFPFIYHAGRLENYDHVYYGGAILSMFYVHQTSESTEI
jgi:hypothetical protein